MNGYGWDNWYKESERARTKNAWRGVGDVSWLSFKGAETEKQCKCNYSSNKTQTFRSNNSNYDNNNYSNNNSNEENNLCATTLIGIIFFIASKYFGVL